MIGRTLAGATAASHNSPMPRSRSPIRRFAVFAGLPALLALAACTTNPATGGQSFTAFMSEEEEVRVGAEEHPKIIEEFGGEYGPLKLRSYVRHVGKRLSRVSEKPGAPFRFTVLNDDEVNAFALPGGYVYVTRGLLALADNEAEMAGVLAHEIGHITARHTAQRHSTAMATQLGLTVLGVLGSAAGVPSGVGQVVSLGAQAALQGYSREQELEADMLGVRYMARAGYDPRVTVDFFRKMGAHAELEARLRGEQGVRHSIMSTHPRTVERIEQAIGLADAQPVPNPRVGRDDFLETIDGMVFGDDIRQGVRKGRDFLHPDLMIRFRVPPGFVLLNSPSRVTAHGPDKARIVFDTAGPKTARRVRSLSAYLIDVWGRNFALQNVERIDVNGMEAVTATARADARDGPRDIRLLVIRDTPERIFRFAFVTRPRTTARLGEELRRTTYSLHRLSATEAAAIRPLRLSVATVGDDDTRVSLADRMPFARYKREWFDVLNGTRPGVRLEPGLRVKIVTE